MDGKSLNSDQSGRDRSVRGGSRVRSPVDTQMPQRGRYGLNDVTQLTKRHRSKAVLMQMSAVRVRNSH